MVNDVRRRDFLEGTALLAGAAAMGLVCVEVAGAEPIQVPEIDQLSVRVLIDLIHNTFLRETRLNGVTVRPAPRASDFRRTLHTQWGLSLLLDSQRGSEARSFMLDYGYTPDALINKSSCSTSAARKSTP